MTATTGSSPGRLLLLEFFPTALRRNEKSMLFPFLQGLARRVGWETLWLSYGASSCPSSEKTLGRTTVAGLSLAARASLKRRLAAFRPTRVIAGDLLAPATAALVPGHLVMPTLFDCAARGRGDAQMTAHAAVASADPERPDYLGKCRWFLDWLGARAPELEDGWLVSCVIPDYAALAANTAARRASAPITIVGGRLCGDRRKLAENPLYRGLDLGGARYGCAFCRSAEMPSLTPPGEDVVVLVEKQLRGLLACAGAAKSSRVYELYDFAALWRCDEVFERILSLNLKPSIFLLNPRLDDVLKLRSRLEKVLPGLARAGHQLRFLSMGVENFSERENERLNKSITLAQVDAFLALVKDWQARFPGVLRPFKAGHAAAELGLILFTPWTTLADVRLNLERAAARGFPARGYWLYSTLLIREAEPIHALARLEGDLLAERWPDAGQGYGLYKNEGESGPLVAWRFRDRRSAEFFRLLVRVCAADREGKSCRYFAGDRDFAAVRRLYDQAKRRRLASPLALARALLSVMQARPELSGEALLRPALGRLPPRRMVPRTRRIRGSSRAAAVTRAYARLKGTRLRKAAALELASVEDLVESGERPLRLTFSGAPAPLIVDLFDRQTPGPSFLVSQRYRAVCHGRGGVAPAQSRFLSVLLRAAEAA